jgi:hypothetical protein
MGSGSQTINQRRFETTTLIEPTEYADMHTGVCKLPQDSCWKRHFSSASRFIKSILDVAYGKTMQVSLQRRECAFNNPECAGEQSSYGLSPSSSSDLAVIGSRYAQWLPLVRIAQT